MNTHQTLPLFNHAPDNVQAAAAWLRQHASALQTDSRQLQAGQAFIAWPGAAHDARVHVAAALQRGAAAALAEASGAETFAFAQPQAAASNGGKVALYQGLRQATALIAAEFYRHPSRAMDVIAVTGTKAMISYMRDHTVNDGLEYVATWNSAMLQSNDLRVAIEDDGQASADWHEGNGIAGMRERLAALHGRVRLQRNARGAMRIDAELPA